MKKFNFSTPVFLIIVLSLTSLFVACDKQDVDNQKPVINIIEPEEDELVTPGDIVHFEVELSDNVALSSYKVDIHGASDGHSHNASVMSTRAAGDSIEFEKTWLESDFIALGETPIAGKRHVTVEHQQIVIPASISRTINGVTEQVPLKEGHYHFIVYCTDEAGQESFTTTEIFISYDVDGHVH